MRAAWSFSHLLLGLVLLFGCHPAWAITIDEFDDAQIVTAAGPGSVGTGVVESQRALGGTRSVHTQVTVGLGIRSESAGGLFTHSQNATTSGFSILTWDGDTSPALPGNYTGLGGVDFTKDGSTALRLEVNSFDFAYGNSIDIIITIFDARDPTGARSSTGKITLGERITSRWALELPFDKLISFGSGGAADLAHVGAVQLQIIGINNPEADLSLAWFGTNGFCAHVPVGGLIYDQCGVCGGDNASCSDCVGVPNGTTGPGSFCDTGALGACGAGVYQGTAPNCSCVQTSQATTEKCDLVDNDCDGVVDEGLADRCGVCGGNGTSCLGCSSVNQTNLLFSLDGAAEDQRGAILAGLRHLKRVSGTTPDLEFERSALESAGLLYVRNWTLSWQLPRVSSSCSNSTYCADATNEPLVSEYRKHANEFRMLGESILDRIRSAEGVVESRGQRRVRQAVQRAYRKSTSLAGSVPVTQSVCTADSTLVGVQQRLTIEKRVRR